MKGAELQKMDKLEAILWSENLEVSYPLIDKHHKKLFALTKKLYDTMYSRSWRREHKIKKIAEALKDYTVYHFSAEEEIMQKYACPLYTDHKKQHDKFVQTIEDAFPSLLHGDIIDREKIYKFLVDWLIEHVTGADRAWVDWIDTHCPKGIKKR